MIPVNATRRNEMNASLEIHDTRPQRGFKLEGRVVVCWVVDRSFQPAIQSAIKGAYRIPHITPDARAAGVTNAVNRICHFTNY